MRDLYLQLVQQEIDGRLKLQAPIQIVHWFKWGGLHALTTKIELVERWLDDLAIAPDDFLHFAARKVAHRWYTSGQLTRARVGQIIADAELCHRKDEAIAELKKLLNQGVEHYFG